ncbi:MAG: hypothetical protein WD359_01960 [Dehalococcoidia bacterium]
MRSEISCYHDREDIRREEASLDSDYRIDVSEVNRNIDLVDVIAMYFPLLRKTLLMDLRTSEVDGPMIRVVPMANTPEERFQSLIKMRPRFGKPDTITIIPWPKYVQSVVALGIWDHIVRRYADTGSAAMVRQCEKCLAELAKLEREETARAITGENYETIWGKPGVAEVTSNLLEDESDEDFDDEDDIVEDFFENDD